MIDLPAIYTYARPLRRLMRAASRAAVLVAILTIRSYQALLRPHLVGSCKFYPSCSEYGIEALQVHGIARGTALTARRICRCHPFTSGGLDPVPPPPAPSDAPAGEKPHIRAPEIR